MMRKKKVWIAGCTVFLLLLICTVLSLRIEKMMRIEVETVNGIPCSEEELKDYSRVPLSCFKEENGSMVLFFLEEREGLFGKELVAVKEENYPLMEEKNMGFVVSSTLLDEQGKGRRIVNYSAWPLKNGNVVMIAGEEE